MTSPTHEGFWAASRSFLPALIETVFRHSSLLQLLIESATTINDRTKSLTHLHTSSQRSGSTDDASRQPFCAVTRWISEEQALSLWLLSPGANVGCRQRGGSSVIGVGESNAARGRAASASPICHFCHALLVLRCNMGAVPGGQARGCRELSCASPAIFSSDDTRTTNSVLY